MSNLAAVYRKDLQMSCRPSVSQVEFSRQAKVPQPTWRAAPRQRATSAVGRGGPSARGQERVHGEGHCARTGHTYDTRVQVVYLSGVRHRLGLGYVRVRLG